VSRFVVSTVRSHETTKSTRAPWFEFRKAVSPFLRLALAFAFYHRGSYERAVEELWRPLELHEGFWIPYAHLRLNYIAVNKLPEPIAILGKGVAIAPWKFAILDLLGGRVRASRRSCPRRTTARAVSGELLG
jgi:hypothetical protein